MAFSSSNWNFPLLQVLIHLSLCAFELNSLLQFFSGKMEVESSHSFLELGLKPLDSLSETLSTGQAADLQFVIWFGCNENQPLICSDKTWRVMKFCLKFLKDFYLCFVASHFLLLKNCAYAFCGGYDTYCYCQAYIFLAFSRLSYS